MALEQEPTLVIMHLLSMTQITFVQCNTLQAIQRIHLLIIMAAGRSCHFILSGNAQPDTIRRVQLVSFVYHTWAQVGHQALI